MTPLIGFAPDLDPTTPGVITGCDMLIPTLKGMKGAPSLTTVATLPAACQGAAVVRMVDDTFRVFAGTQTDLYELSGGAFTDRAAATLVGSVDSVWRFGQYGNVTIAVNKVDATQKTTGTGVAFSALAGAPKASFIDTASNFVMLADYDDSVNNYADGWYCSGIGDYTNWTTGVPAQCANGRLLDTPGPIKGIKRLGEYIIAYKERSVYIGQYVGPPVIWQWKVLAGDIGAASQESIVSIDTAHIFVGEDDFYICNGSTITPIENPVKEWFFRDINPTYRYKIRGMHDKRNFSVHFYYASGASTTLNACIVYNYRSNKWGVADRDIEFPLEYITSGSTSFDSDTGTFDDAATDFPFDAASEFASARVSAVFDSSHILKTLSGTAGQSSFTTGDIGDDYEVITVSRANPRFITNPTTATLTNYYRMNLGDSLDTDQTVSMNSNRFDLLRSARWHRFTMTMSGEVEIIGADIKATNAGLE